MLQHMLCQIVKDYTQAQHPKEITEMAGGAVFEIVLTMILAALTAGAAAVAVAGSKARLISTFSKVGALLRKFAQAARKLKIQSRNRKAKGKPADFKDLETIEALGQIAGSKKFFAVLSYNNSPNNLLGDDPQISGSFGYFTAEMAKDAATVLESLQDSIEQYTDECAQAVAENAPLSRDTLEYTFFKYLSAFQEAASEDKAVVVIHE